MPQGKQAPKYRQPAGNWDKFLPIKPTTNSYKRTHFNVILAFPSKISLQLEMCSKLLASQTSKGERLQQNLTINNQGRRQTSRRLHEHQYHITPLFGSIVH